MPEPATPRKGGHVWYWYCQGCGICKAEPSRTDLYCSFCKRWPNHAPTPEEQ